MLYSGLIVAIALAASVCPACVAQAPTYEDRIEAGREAVGSGNYDRAIDLLNGVVERDADEPEAQYLLAQALLATNRLKEARRAIGKARALDGSSLKFAVAEIEILRASSPRESSISLTDGRREALAASVLEQDPDNAAALEELGLRHAMNYRWYANFDATKQPLGDGVARHAREEFDLAAGFLHRSIAADPKRLTAYSELLRLLVEEGRWTDAAGLGRTAVDAMPSNYTPWLFRGLVAQLQNRSEEAAPFFERAIESMPVDLRIAFTDVSLFLNERDRDRYRSDPKTFVDFYWAERDPFRITDVNERKMDHYARMAYAELWYGGMGTPGWETERGRIVIRYGIPWSDSSFIGGYSRFNVLEYRDFEFVFEDVTRGGHYTMYSPKAGPSSSWTTDYVIQAAEMALSNPEQYDPRLTGPVDILAETFAFRGNGNASDVYVHMLIPTSEGPGADTISGAVGAFLLNDGRVVDRSVLELSGALPHGNPRGVETTQVLRPTPGRYRLRMEFLGENRLSAGHLEVDADVHGFGGDTLSVSDLVAASTVDDSSGVAGSDPNRIIRSGYVIQPMTWTHVSAGSDLLVYFEMYGLGLDPAGRGSYRIGAALEKPGGKGRVRRFLSKILGGADDTEVALQVESTSKGADEARLVSIGLPSDIEGDYRLVLEITDLQRRQTVRREHDLRVAPATDH